MARNKKIVDLGRYKRCKQAGESYVDPREEIRKLGWDELIGAISVRVEDLSPYMEVLYDRSLEEPTNFNPVVDETTDTFNQFSAAISHMAGIYVGDLLHRAIDLPDLSKKPKETNPKENNKEKK